MATENELESPAVLNAEILRGIDQAPPEAHLKNASDKATNLVRRRIRENGWSRLIQPYVQVTDSDLDPLPDTERPAIIENMEPDSKGAKSMSFNDSAETATYRGDKFVVCCYEPQ